MCFSLALLVQFIVILIVIGAIFAIARVLLPSLIGELGPWGAKVYAVLRIIVGCIILVWVVYLVYDLFVCMFPMGRIR